MNRFFILACSLLLAVAPHLRALAQDDNPQEMFNPIPVASPILIVPPDARSSGMGDVGAATSPDVYSQHWNAAKFPFAPNKIGAALAYSPWLRGLVKDVNIAVLSGYWQFLEQQAVAVSLRYFSLGSMSIINEQGITQSEASPYEMAVDVSWTRKFGDNFAFALTGRYIRSDLIGGVSGQNQAGYAAMQPANAASFDLGGYYQRALGRSEEMAFGMNLSNLGTKVNYSGDVSGYFLPMNLRLGARYGLPIDDDNHISFAIDFNKLLVPTPGKRDTGYLINRENEDISVPMAVLKSFADAPYGFLEEISEINFGLGGEYTYRGTFFGRMGFFYDSKRKGNRRYLTFGAGMRYNFLQLDLSYYVPFTNNDPMANTVKFSLSMYFNYDSRESTRSYQPQSTSRRRTAQPAADEETAPADVAPTPRQRTTTPQRQQPTRQQSTRQQRTTR